MRQEDVALVQKSRGPRPIEEEVHMGFMDKVKATAQDVAADAKKMTTQAQHKMGEVQLKKKMDEAAKELGYLIYQERTEGVTEGSETDRLVTEMQSLKRQIAEARSAAASAQAGATTPLVETPPEQTPPPPPTTPGSSTGPTV
ncbi:hypothetical protein BH18ACT15_BH18ACT15_14160 [soil metagenome]